MKFTIAKNLRGIPEGFSGEVVTIDEMEVLDALVGQGIIDRKRVVELEAPHNGRGYLDDSPWPSNRCAHVRRWVINRGSTSEDCLACLAEGQMREAREQLAEVTAERDKLQVAALKQYDRLTTERDIALKAFRALYCFQVGAIKQSLFSVAEWEAISMALDLLKENEEKERNG